MEQPPADPAAEGRDQTLREDDREDGRDRQAGDGEDGRDGGEGEGETGQGVLGGRRSEPERRKVAPRTWARDGPNMLTADSSGEPVARWTRVPRARPATVWAAVWAAEESRSGVNSGVRGSCR